MNSGIRHTFIASAPAALLGCWGLGRQLGGTSVDSSSVWQLAMLDRFGIYDEDPGVLTALATGLAFLVPLLAVALVVSCFWAGLFARLRQRPHDPGWHLTAWLFTLLLPATTPLVYAALGMSFGAVFGSHVFGGSGRYIVNPALLGVVFLTLAWPALTAADAWLPGGMVVSLLPPKRQAESFVPALPTSLSHRRPQRTDYLFIRGPRRISSASRRYLKSLSVGSRTSDVCH